MTEQAMGAREAWRVIERRKRQQRCDFTVTIVDDGDDVWVTLIGNRSGARLRRKAAANLLIVIFTIARLWIEGAAMLAKPAAASTPEEPRNG